MKNNAWKYSLPFIMYMSAWVSFTSTGIASWLPVILGFVLIPVAELLIPVNRNNLSEDAEAIAKNDPVYDNFLYLFVVMQFIALFMFLHSMEDLALSTGDRIGRIVGMGILCGTFGINLGHELGHRITATEQWMARLSLLSSLYLHFMIEHNKGHHKYVATEQDPTSARYGENIYSFWARSTFGTFASAWRIAKSEEPVLLKNEMIWMQMAHILFSISIGLAFGWDAMGYFIAAALIGILLLNTVNYIEHYGLVRKATGDNSYERAMPEHSWNSNHVIGRIILFELSRHSDHHYLASRKYQVLRHHDDSPELPTGYPGSMLLTLVPPLWFKVIHKKMESYKGNSMKRSFYLLLLLFSLGSCVSTDEKAEETRVVNTGSDTPTQQVNLDPLVQDESYDTEDQYAEFYVVIADTGKDYYQLDDKMYVMSKAVKLDIDTMNRYYNKDKKKIVVPENDEDEMYRGEYYPRRSGSSHLSVEYLDMFDENAGDGTMALVGCISETKRDADSILALLRLQAPKSYVRISKLYIGCMH